MMIHEMPESACIALVTAERLARMACAKDNIPYLVPLHYAYSAHRLYGFSLPGKKLDILRANPRVCLEIDDYTSKRRWRSVIVDALFHELPDVDGEDGEIRHAWSLLQHHTDWWEPGAMKPEPQTLHDRPSHIFFALEIIAMSGREATEGNALSLA
jgi:nitroimidazol reductase NimA-like FMN-containing flavoprotein (pyridoxamine 5'-phosphate oxidase superfamily)